MNYSMMKNPVLEQGMAGARTASAPAREEAAIGDNLDAVLLFNLLRTHNHLAPFIDAELRRQRLTAAQFNTLLVLRGAGPQGLLMGEIGRRLVVTKANVTGLIDRLEREGLAARGTHTDRRAIVVRLTRAGSRLLGRTAPRHARLLADLTACLTVREKRELVRLLTKVRRGLRQRRQETTQ